jgi:hypothetical protein
MAPCSNAVFLLQELSREAQVGGFERLPLQKDRNLVVTPRQVLDFLHNNPGSTVSFGDCVFDSTYYLQVQWGGKEYSFLKYERGYWIEKYGPASWDLVMSEGENPFEG